MGHLLQSLPFIVALPQGVRLRSRGEHIDM